MTVLNTQAPPEMPLWIVILIPIAFFIVFPIFWCFVMWINSHISGWRRLAKPYGTDRKPEGKVYSGQQGAIGIVSYRRCLDVAVSEEGVFLRPGVLFRFAHPQLYVPWTEFHNAERKQVLMLPAMVRADLGNPRVARVRLPLKVFEGPQGEMLLPDDP